MCQVLLAHVWATGDLTEQFQCGDGVKAEINKAEA